MFVIHFLLNLSKCYFTAIWCPGKLFRHQVADSCEFPNWRGSFTGLTSTVLPCIEHPTLRESSSFRPNRKLGCAQGRLGNDLETNFENEPEWQGMSWMKANLLCLPWPDKFLGLEERRGEEGLVGHWLSLGEHCKFPFWKSLSNTLKIILLPKHPPSFQIN